MMNKERSKVTTCSCDLTLEDYKQQQELDKKKSMKYFEKHIIGMFNALGIIGLAAFSTLGLLILFIVNKTPIIQAILLSVVVMILLISSALMKEVK
jgi:hypothetical protein